MGYLPLLSVALSSLGLGLGSVIVRWGGNGPGSGGVKAGWSGRSGEQIFCGAGTI